MWDDVVSCPSGESLPHTLLHRYISPGKKYTGARGDFALEMQKRALKNKKEPLKIAKDCNVKACSMLQI